LLGWSQVAWLAVVVVVHQRKTLAQFLPFLERTVVDEYVLNIKHPSSSFMCIAIAGSKHVSMQLSRSLSGLTDLLFNRRYVEQESTAVQNRACLRIIFDFYEGYLVQGSCSLAMRLLLKTFK